MSKTEKSYRIDSYEPLQPNGDASKFLVRYTKADNEQCTENLKEASVIIRLSGSAIGIAKLDNVFEQAKVVTSFLEGKIEDSMKKSDELPSEMLITSDDLPAIPHHAELYIGVCHTVIIERKMGFPIS